MQTQIEFEPRVSHTSKHTSKPDSELAPRPVVEARRLPARQASRLNVLEALQYE